MNIWKIAVDQDNAEGFILFSESPEEIGYIIRISLKNGFEDIRIIEATPQERIEYRKAYRGEE